MVNGDGLPRLADEYIQTETAVDGDVGVGSGDPIGVPSVARKLPDISYLVQFIRKGRGSAAPLSVTG